MDEDMEEEGDDSEISGSLSAFLSVGWMEGRLPH